MWEQAKNRLNPQSLFDDSAMRAMRSNTLGIAIIRESMGEQGSCRAYDLLI